MVRGGVGPSPDEVGSDGRNGFVLQKSGGRAKSETLVLSERNISIKQGVNSYIFCIFILEINIILTVRTNDTDTKQNKL